MKLTTHECYEKQNNDLKFFGTFLTHYIIISILFKKIKKCHKKFTLLNENFTVLK